MSAMSELDVESTAKVKVTITTMDGEVLESVVVTAPSLSSKLAMAKDLVNMIAMNYDTEDI